MVYSIISYVLFGLILASFIYLKVMARKSEVVFAIVIEQVNDALRSLEKPGRGNVYLMEVEEDGQKNKFKYRPKSSFWNVSFGMAVDFYRTKTKTGYKYVARDGYYFNLWYLVVPTIIFFIAGLR